MFPGQFRYYCNVCVIPNSFSVTLHYRDMVSHSRPGQGLGSGCAATVHPGPWDCLSLRAVWKEWSVEMEPTVTTGGGDTVHHPRDLKGMAARRVSWSLLLRSFLVSSDTRKPMSHLLTSALSCCPVLPSKLLDPMAAGMFPLSMININWIVKNIETYL